MEGLSQLLASGYKQFRVSSHDTQQVSGAAVLLRSTELRESRIDAAALIPNHRQTNQSRFEFQPNESQDCSWRFARRQRWDFPHAVPTPHREAIEGRHQDCSCATA